MRDEEKASGIDCEMSEKDVLLEELCEREALVITTVQKKEEKEKEIEKAEAIRKKAMTRMPGKLAEGEKGGKKRSGSDVVEFLMEKAKQEKENREEKARQHERHMEMLKRQSEQQSQMTQALLMMITKMSNK